MKAEKLPNGKYRARAYNKATGERPYFTADTKKEAERLARQYQYTCKNRSSMLFSEAYDLYIQAHPKWSPRTIADYKRWRTTRFAEFMELELDKITSEMLQKWVDKQLAEISPKTAANRLCPIKAVMKRYAPSVRIVVDVGKKNKAKLNLPSQATIDRLFEVCEDTEYCVPIYLAALCAMRRGEVAALKIENVNFTAKTIRISENKVYDENRQWVIKAPKNGEERTITVPDKVLEKIKKHGIPEIPNPDNFSNQFGKFLEKSELPHFRFHDLRHYCAARMLAIGIPISVVQEYGGWKTKHVLLDIYDYVINEVRDESMDRWNAFVNKLPIFCP